MQIQLARRQLRAADTTDLWFIRCQSARTGIVCRKSEDFAGSRRGEKVSQTVFYLSEKIGTRFGHHSLQS